MIGWLQLLLLALLWALAVGWHFLDPLSIGGMKGLWPMLAAGSIGYLGTQLQFVRSDRVRIVSASHQIISAIAVAGICGLGYFLMVGWFQEAPSPVTGAAATTARLSEGGHDQLSPLNALAAVLGVVLALVALVASKSATDAKAEARRARADILEALNIQLLAHASRFLERSQAAKAEADDLLAKANESMGAGEQIGRLYNLAAYTSTRLSKMLATLHGWVLDPELTPLDDLRGKAKMLALDVRTLDEALRDAPRGFREEAQRLRLEHWQPASRILEEALISIHRSSRGHRDDEVAGLLRDLRRALHRL
jgi:hypothetical protein